MKDNYVAKAFFSYKDLILNNANQLTNKVAETAAKQTEAILLQQLKELTSRGLIVIEETEPMLSMVQRCAEQDAYELCITRGVRLVLKDQEYVESLEKKVADLETQLKESNDLLNKINAIILKETVAMEQTKE